MPSLSPGSESSASHPKEERVNACGDGTMASIGMAKGLPFMDSGLNMITPMMDLMRIVLLPFLPIKFMSLIFLSYSKMMRRCSKIWKLTGLRSARENPKVASMITNGASMELATWWTSSEKTKIIKKNGLPILKLSIEKWPKNTLEPVSTLPSS